MEITISKDEVEAANTESDASSNDTDLAELAELIEKIKRENYYSHLSQNGITVHSESYKPYEEWKKENGLGIRYYSDEITAPQCIKTLDGKRIATVGGLKFITNFEKLTKEINAIYNKDFIPKKFIPEEVDIVVSSNTYYKNFIRKQNADTWRNIQTKHPDLLIIRESEFLKMLGFEVPLNECKGEDLQEKLTNYTVIDLETTSKNPVLAEIIEMAAVKVRNGKIIDTYTTLIRPNNSISATITKLTGITNEMLENAPLIENKIQEYFDFIGDDVVLGHNIRSYDTTILYMCSEKFNLPPFINDMLDTLKYAHCCDIDVPNYKLATLSEYFDIKYDAHRALNDCIANFKCYEILKTKYTGKYKNASKTSNSKSGNDKSASYSINEEYSNISEKNIVLTGDFKIGKRNEVKSFLEKNGASVKTSVSGKTNYVIIGSLGSEDWKFGSYGEKVEKALELQSKGKDVKIIKEEEFLNV